MNLNIKIRYLREKNELSQAILAKVLNKSRTTIAGYESGDREPDLETLKKIVTFFNVSSDYLLFDDREIEISDGYISNTNAISTVVNDEEIQQKYAALSVKVDAARKKMNEAIKNNNDVERKEWNKKYREALAKRKLFEQSEEYKIFYEKFIEEIRRDATKYLLKSIKRE